MDYYCTSSLGTLDYRYITSRYLLNNVSKLRFSTVCSAPSNFSICIADVIKGEIQNSAHSLKLLICPTLRQVFTVYPAVMAVIARKKH